MPLAASERTDPGVGRHYVGTMKNFESFCAVVQKTIITQFPKNYELEYCKSTKYCKSTNFANVYSESSKILYSKNFQIS